MAGATGSTGSLIVKELLEQGYGVRAGARSLQKVAGITPCFLVLLARKDLRNDRDNLM